jgi:hypothetical protein
LVVGAFSPGRAPLGAIAFGGKLPGLSIEQALAQTPGGASMAKASISAKVMSASYAYALKQLEAAFYPQVTKTYADKASADTDILSGYPRS